MNEIKTMQIKITAISSILAAVLGVLYIPVLLMVSSNIIDYITGLIAAAYRDDGGISSYRSMKGIFKKICMWMLVVVGAIVDELLKYAADTTGKTLPFTYLVACVVSIWIVCNELISILENMVDIGVDIPPFLMPIVKRIKKQAEEQTIVEDKED